MKANPKFIISGGGTGGHIYPAIAIANEIKAQIPAAEILFVGAKDKMEMQKVPAAGYEIKGLWISGIQRKITLDNAMFPLKFVSSLLKSRKIIKEFKPDVVIGTGGFASGAVVKVAQQMNIPTVIQEQNSYPGITNKMLAPKANAICVAYDGLAVYFKSNNITKTGNPVRQDLLTIDTKRSEAQTFYGLNPNKKTVVILGGSLGARRINQLVEKELSFFKEQNVQVIWQCGKFYINDYKKYHNNKDVFVFDFIERMDLLFAAADVIVSRAGASSVSELAIVGKPVIFIPSPNVAEDHQTKNAKSITDKNAAVLLKEADLDSQFQEQMLRLLTNDQVAEALSKNIKTLALPNATKDIVKQILNLVQ
ncbi:undecaprenyldiphospho-muramoylpentapeptide beta-N-acetylglucosaminyltransferase [Flavobacterium sp. xlx-214]|uniref:undecaprenyldiphospho-muramoylpentapeptide beta-N-acetylglucosaminyltransferase n=1 Tax=unclassified Flavobacterium TaxID=196869 RepID=UPI0013D24B67|nr:MULTISPECIES: undecaprenyldiphospho-muramoylpentapeptide beta-N-acetylglucosaminyltransferase [unclassified Flavobacterium]MBA5791931.1 undecaprenyldiphospho-muramoylpentapeptide beta-N-acetylglucosaminyltransferase [Flavobacterium sp. xlx-221]QMI84187.1 undecaprenyldiphospho-muramoylpentapeptide beta-N-acetylglucosaminyltransferase [Flavobacterium sp. xlx-214]